uniref:Putative secreted protein n=1 Tax=Ixodes ricinus TaxID=34613 RepID=A0A6B0TTM7_IXORI
MGLLRPRRSVSKVLLAFVSSFRFSPGATQYLPSGFPRCSFSNFLNCMGIMPFQNRCMQQLGFSSTQKDQTYCVP